MAYPFVPYIDSGFTCAIAIRAVIGSLAVCLTCSLKDSIDLNYCNNRLSVFFFLSASPSLLLLLTVSYFALQLAVFSIIASIFLTDPFQYHFN